MHDTTIRNTIAGIDNAIFEKALKLAREGKCSYTINVQCTVTSTQAQAIHEGWRKYHNGELYIERIFAVINAENQAASEASATHRQMDPFN